MNDTNGNISLGIMGLAFLAAGYLGDVKPLFIIGMVWVWMSAADEVGRWWQHRHADREALEEYRRRRNERE